MIAAAMWFVSFATVQQEAGGGHNLELLRRVVEAATSRPAGPRWRTAIRCPGGGLKKRCRARIDVDRADMAAMTWACAACLQHGFLVDFEGTDADLSGHVPSGKTVLWGIDDKEREVLAAATTHIPELRAVISRARLHKEIEGLLLVDATVAELDEVYTLVEELTDATRNRRRIELLDGLRASLCTSMDGF
jgi:hypothetical protein